MPPVMLEGPSLGHKHRNYNRIIKESIANQTTDPPKDIDFDEDDVNNLVKVDIASINRNVDYILGVLKGNDMMYVSRAIARCPWLITDSNYANFINPEYLHTQLIPNMMAKAGNKLMLHIRLTLRDEIRVESFFNYYEQLNLKTALKWLPHCSAAFMESIVKKKEYTNIITPHLLKRLCEKSHHVLEAFVKSEAKCRYNLSKYFQETIFLMQTHTDFYLDLVETGDRYGYPKFNAKCTKFLMKTCPQRIHQKFDKYGDIIHIPTFVKFLDGSQVRDFLLKQANTKSRYADSWIRASNLIYFLWIMPQDERIKFITDIFVNKCFKEDKDSERSSSTDDDDADKNNDDNSRMARLYTVVSRRETDQLLYWYKCLPFDVALEELKEKMKITQEDHYRDNMLQAVTWIVDRDMQHLEPLLQYYNDNHLKDSRRSQLQFVNNLFKHPTNVLNYDSKCWGLLMNILNSSIDIDESNRTDFHEDQTWVKAVIVHEVINQNKVPENIRKRFYFSTLQEYQKKMNVQQKTLLFEYLYNDLFNSIEQKKFDAHDHEAFNNNVELIKLMLKLLNNWQKNLAEYSYVWNKIKQLIKTKRDNSLKASLVWIYDSNKSWRKYMFEESIILCESERVCVNALKHDASLLSRNEELVAAMRCNDAISLRQLHIKVKVYWADSLASEWSQWYREKLVQPLGHKAIIRGLTFLLSQRDLSDIINTYKPDETNINWEKNDEILISLRKHIAKNMHFARPQPSPELIQQYAKGDYLQFALPSLKAILHNLCSVRCEELIPKWLNSPVSLQKHVIRLAFIKMQSDDLQRIFSSHWKSIKNLSIRAVLFKLTYDLLCKEKNPTKVDNIWSLLKIFIKELSFEEDKTIYEHLAQVNKVPLRVRPFYLIKSYTFLKALLPKSDIDKSKYEHSLENLIREMITIMEIMEPEFVANILQEYFAIVYTKDKPNDFVHKDMMPLIAAYLKWSASEEVQIQRYKMVLLPLLKHTVAVWAETDKNDIVKTNLKKLLKLLRQDLKFSVQDNKIVPVAMFSDIQKEIDQSLDHNVAYIMLREWKLTTAFAKVINDIKVNVDRGNFTEDNNEEDENNNWIALTRKAAPQFGKICLEFLREDLKAFFPCIDEYFSIALGNFFNDLLNYDVQIEVLKHMLSEDLIQSYLVTIRTLNSYISSETKQELRQLHNTILSHPSLEVKMHFYHKFKDYRYNHL